ncbi:hypothetical protein MMC07_003877 [Pseudocyphellaria aurata]|nr:hypothetical protein [Pseudocyphellaria aurata]
MATPYSLQGFNSTASLANNTTGTTFAAKARAAELNAVRSRKPPKEMESEDEVQSAAPAVLAPIKLAKPRHRGKGWRALNLEELPEESLHGEESKSERTVSAERSNPPVKPHVGQDENYRIDNGGRYLTYENSEESQMLYPHNFPPPRAYPESMTASQPQKREKMPASYNLSVWDPDTSPARTNGPESFHQPSSGHLTPQAPSRSSPALSQQGFIPMHEPGSQGRSVPGVPPVQVLKRPEHDVDVGPSQRRLSSLEESKLKKLGVLPPLQTQQPGSYPTQKNSDDPFTGPSQAMHTHAPQLYTADQFFAAGLRSTGRTMPSAMRGTSSHEFNLSQPQNMSKTNSYPRDPMPYSSFSANSKKDVLLRNLHSVVESSKTQGTLPNSTRTVLYDPVAHEPGKNAQPSPTEVAFKRAQQHAANPNASTMMVAHPDNETLKVSDPLPWTDRPVSIHNSTSPMAPQFPTLTVMPTVQSTPSSLGLSNPDIWSLAQRNPPTRPALEDVDAWWNNVHRRDEFKRILEMPVTRGGNRSDVLDTPVRPAHRAVQDRSSGVDNSFRNTPSKLPSDVEVIRSLMIPAMKILAEYVDDSNPGHFKRFSRVPEWCIDKSEGGNKSFFGDWGVPPSRVGRDPRYRPTFHEGRFTVFEELDRRGVRDGLGRNYA